MGKVLFLVCQCTHRRGRGTPVLPMGRGGYLIADQDRGGYNHPRSGWDVPHLRSGYSMPNQDRGVLPSQVRMGVLLHQQDGYTLLSAGWGYPPSRSQVRTGGTPTGTAQRVLATHGFYASCIHAGELSCSVAVFCSDVHYLQ